MVDLKQGNRRAILTLLHENGGMSRKQIAAKLHLTPAAITTIVGEMITENVVHEVGLLEGTGNVGRKEIVIDICPDKYFAIGVYYGIERVIVSVTDIKGILLSSETFLYDYDTGADSIITKVCGVVHDAKKRFERLGKICIGVGVSVRGIVNDFEGVCHDSYGSWPERDIPVRELMAKKLDGDCIFVKHNVRALAQAYIFIQSGRAIDSMLFIKNDLGIGAAIVFDQHVYSGYRSKAAEIGHIEVDRSGRPCRCGGVGCLETISSCKSIERAVREICSESNTPILWQLAAGDPAQIDLQVIAQAVQRREAPVMAVVDNAMRQLGRVLRIQLGMLDIQWLILHGLIFEDEYFYRKLLEEINFDGRCKDLEQMTDRTRSDSNLDARCSPILAVMAFYQNGGRRSSANP